jgi:membrane associated rhomboid family serine protease
LGGFFGPSLTNDESYSVFLGAFRSDFFANGLFWTILTTNFVHLYFWHFLFNAISLYQLGKITESFFGSKLLWTAYIIGGILGVFLAYLSFEATSTVVVATGASAGVYAFIGMLFGGTYRNNKFEIDLPIDRRMLLITIIPALLVNFLPNVSWQGHLGGFIAGILIGKFFSNKLNIQNKLEKKLENRLFAISMSVLVISYALLVLNLLFNFVNL